MESQLNFLPAPATPDAPKLGVVGALGAGCFSDSQSYIYDS